MNPFLRSYDVAAGMASALAGARTARRARGQRPALAAVARLTPRPSHAGVALLPRYPRGVTARRSQPMHVLADAAWRAKFRPPLAVSVSGVKSNAYVEVTHVAYDQSLADGWQREEQKR